MEFYGRAAELKTLLDAFAECVATGAPRLVTVIAETGVGKSRLVQRFYDTITTDEQYDPASSNYWPDAFQTPARQLRVTPDMHEHMPAGPPRFWWLGVRWSNPTERNVLVSSVLPELKKQLTLHAAITKSFASAWQLSLENVIAKTRDEDLQKAILIESLTLLLQVNIPLSGMLIDMIRPAIDPWTGNDIVYADDHEEEVREELRTVLLQAFRSIYEKKNRLPIVLWLDDAQWMDADSREFFRQLYTQAVARKWPLFFLATHWPQEWEEYGKTTFLGRGLPLTLGEPAQSDMAALLRNHLPGVSATQEALILAKSVGNYLALLENIGQLLADTSHFVDGNSTSALSAHGEAVVSEWETNRQRRIQQRFEAFEIDVRMLLARFSHIGSTFFRSVIRAYATNHHVVYSEALVNRCIAPLTIVSELSAEFHEFRDRGYFSVAKQYFSDWLYEEEHIGLTEALREEVTRYVASGYTAEAEFARESDTLFARLTDQEQALVLNLALQSSAPGNQLWIRTVLLRCTMLARNRQWEAAGVVAALLSDYDWKSHDEAWVHHHAMEEMVGVFVASGAVTVALALQLHFLEVAEAECDVEENPTTLKSLSVVYNMLGDTHQDMGDTTAALEYYRADLETTQQLILLQNTPENQRTLSVIHNRIGMCLLDNGENDAASVELEKGWVIIQSLLTADASDALRRDVSFTAMELAFAAHGQSDKAKARMYIDTAVELRRGLCLRERTPSSVMELAFAIHKQSYVKRTNAARIKVTEEALALCREAMQLRGNAADMVTLIEIQETLGQEYCQAGKYDLGFAAFDEAVAVQTKLVEMRGTVMERRQLVRRLTTYLTAGLAKERVLLDRLLPEIRTQTKQIAEAGEPAVAFADFAHSLLSIARGAILALGSKATLEDIQSSTRPFLSEVVAVMREPVMRVMDDDSYDRIMRLRADATHLATQIEAVTEQLEVFRAAADVLFEGYQHPDHALFLAMSHFYATAGMELAQKHRLPAYARIFETLKIRCEALDSLLS